MSLLAFFEWCERTAIGEAIRNSSWLFPVVEAVHLVGLAMMGGAVLIVDLRLFGLGLRHQPVAQLSRDVEPWLIGSLLLMVATGIPLFLSESIRCYYSTAFWVKMTCLGFAIAFTFTVRRNVAMGDHARWPPLWRKLVALVSLALWSTVGWAGRWIGFS